MKKLTTLLLTITLLFCACNTSANNNDNMSEQPDTPPRYTIYTDSFDASSKKSSAIKENLKSDVALGDITTKSFSFFDFENFENAKAPAKKQLTIDGRSYNLSLEKSFKIPISESKIGKDKSVGIYDAYRYEENGKKLNVEFKQDTDIITFLSGDASDSLVEGSFTEEQAKEKADALIKDLYGEKVFALYTHQSTSTITQQQRYGFSVHYARYVHGYITEETITIKFNRQGNVISINAMKLNLFDNAPNDITKADIEAAEKALRESVSDDWTLSNNITIKMDSTGQYFVNVVGFKNSSDNDIEYEPCDFYININ